MSVSNLNPFTQRIVLLVVGSLLGITSVIFSSPNVKSRALPDRVTISEPVPSIAVLDEMDLPQGINRSEFETGCLMCHSPRLALTQPAFSKKKWGEIVNKMVTAYGAPIAKHKEHLIVDYMVAVQSTR